MRQPFKVGLSIVLVAMLAACGESPKADVVAGSCPQLQKAVQACQLNAAQSSQMMAVVSEQLNAAQPAEQQKICQSATQFWQAACGVAR